MNTGQIKKSRAAGNFTVIPNQIFEDKTLSLKALGLLCFLLKLPADWVLNKSSLYKNLKDGRDAVTNAFNELQAAGYIETEKVREKGKFLGYNYIVSDTSSRGKSASDTIETPPIIAENPKPNIPKTVKPKTGNPKTVKPKTEKPAVNNNIVTNTDNTKITLPFTNVNDKDAAHTGPTEPVPVKTIYERFLKVYSDWFKENNEGMPPKIDGMQGNATKSLIAYIKQIVKARHKTDFATDPAADELENKSLASWELILNSWGLLEPFYQDKTRLTDINQNIQIIIQQLKNGARKKPSNKKIDGSGISAMFEKIDKKHAGTGDGVGVN